MRSVLAPAFHPEPTSRLSGVTREDSFLRTATKIILGDPIWGRDP